MRNFVKQVLGGLGDINFPDYDGGFVFIHEQTGKPEIEYVETPPEDDWDCKVCRGCTPSDCDCEYEECSGQGEWSCVKCKGTGKNLDLRWTVYGVLVERDTWYEKDLDSIETSAGMKDASYDGPSLRELLASDDPMKLAWAIETIAGYWGWHQFDHYPLHLTYEEVQKRYEGLDVRTH